MTGVQPGCQRLAGGPGVVTCIQLRSRPGAGSTESLRLASHWPQPRHRPAGGLQWPGHCASDPAWQPACQRDRGCCRQWSPGPWPPAPAATVIVKALRVTVRVQASLSHSESRSSTQAAGSVIRTRARAGPRPASAVQVKRFGH
jgi:hypothetical protein